MRRLALIAAAVLALGLAGGAAPQKLQIHLIDVEGGQATLLIAPSGESLLIDAGWPGFDGRDANRIVAVAKANHLERIDYVLITHYHRDHVGGVAQLAERIQIGAFVDHGPNREDRDVERENFAQYEKTVGSTRRLVMKPGDKLPIKGLDIAALSADGNVIQKALRGAGQANPVCSSEGAAPADTTENPRSLGVLVSFGKFRMLDLGDLTKDKERLLACPRNLIGRVDLFLVSHHGSDQSNSRAIVAALRSRVAIFDNGARKGASVSAWETVRNAPGLEDIWQLHRNVSTDAAHNAAEPYIANPEENCLGHNIQVTALPSGSFTVTNLRNNLKKSYLR